MGLAERREDRDDRLLELSATEDPARNV